MAVYNVVGYYNTGFGAGNVPDSPSVVQLATSKTFPSNWLLQDRDLATTRLNAGWADVQNIDYVRIGSVYYFVTAVRMLTEVCAELALQIDPLTTAGGISALDITDGWCTRAHAASDGLFENTLDEPWTPSTPLDVKGKDIFKGSASGDNVLVCSSVELVTVEKVADEYLDTEGNIACYVPKVPAIEGGTKAIMPLFNGYGSQQQTLPNTRVYYLNDYKDEVQVVRSLGLSDAITGCYVLPNAWGGLSVGADQLTGYGYNRTANLPFKYASAQNNKVFALFNTYTLLAMATGDKQTFDASEIYSGAGSPSFRYYADPAPNGRPYAQPTYFEGGQTLPFQNAVKGGQWLNQPIVYGQENGALINQTQFDRGQALQQVQREYNTAKSEVTGVLGMVGNLISGNIAGAINSGAGTVDASVQNFFGEQAQLNQQAQFATAQAIRTPEVTFAYTPSVQGYVGNAFVVFQTGLSAADISRLDRFFNMFGYAQSKQLVKSDFTNRRYFNYVQADNVGVRGNVGLRIREGVTRMLSGGVRIWHTLPNSSYYSSNPIG